MRASLSRCLFAVSLIFGSTAFAAPIAPTVTFEDGLLLTTSDIAGVADYTTSGAEMAGMLVRATFSDGTTEESIWQATGAVSGGATGLDWGVKFDFATTFSNTDRWEVEMDAGSSRTMVGLFFDGRPGDTIFDVIGSPDLTPDSEAGIVFGDGLVDGPSGMDINATYRNKVALGNVFYNDLFTVLDLEFIGTGLSAGDVMTFFADTDNPGTPGDIRPFGVPSPSSIALIGLGLAALFLMRRRTLEKQNSQTAFVPQFA